MNHEYNQFEKSILQLRDDTEEISVVAIGCWGNHERENGIRSGCATHDLDFHDPNIDGMPFMICGEVLDSETWNTVDLTEHIDDLSDSCIVRLRAVGMVCGSSVTIDLGRYSICEVEEVFRGNFDYYTDFAIKLKVKRNGL